MARVLVTGSTTGLGLAAARTLLDAGHDVIVHARNDERAQAFGPLAQTCAGATGADGNTSYPDFTIVDDDTGETYLWEHLGILHVESYRKKWEKKLAWYRANGVDNAHNGGGPNGTLIITEDHPAGGSSSAGIAALLDRFFA